MLCNLYCILNISALIMNLEDFLRFNPLPNPFLIFKIQFSVHCDIMKSLITTHLSRNDQHSQTKSTLFFYCICNLNRYKYKHFTFRNVHLKNNICTNSLRTWQQYLLAKSKFNTRGKPRKSIVWKSSLKLVWTQSA